MGDLLDLEAHAEHIADIVEWKNLTVEKGYGHEPIQAAEMMSWLREYGLPWTDYICDTTLYLNDAIAAGKDVLFEAQLARCGILISASSPIPPAPAPSRLTRRWERGFPTIIWMAPSAL